MDAPITLDPILPAHDGGYRNWIVSLPQLEVAVFMETEQKAIDYLAICGAYAARPARESDYPLLRSERQRQTDAWGRLD